LHFFPRQPRLAARLRILVVGTLVLLTSACASYPSKTANALRDFRRGQFESAREEYADPDAGISPFLAGAEAGMVALTAGDWSDALTSLHLAAEASKDVESRALAGKEALGEELSSWVLNDTTRAYEGEGFERVYVHCGLAMAYLAQGKLDDVYVEARLANQLLEAEESLYEKSYRAGGWGHAMSALAYELLGQYDQAYIDYERMEKKDVGAAYAGPELVRLARLLNRDDELAQWEEKYGEAPAPTEQDPARIVVFAGVGLGPFKVESRLWIPTRDGIVPIAGVALQARPQAVSGLRLTVDQSSVDTTVIEDVARVSAENLEDRQVWAAVKSAARGLLKRELTKKLEEKHGDAGRLAGDLFAVLSERADLRSWLTLPDTWQAARLYVPPGRHALTLDAIGGQSIELGQFELDPGETMIVFARTLDSRLYAHPIGGRLIGATP